MNGVKRRRVDVEYGKGGRGRGGKLTRMRKGEEKGYGDERGWTREGGNRQSFVVR